MRLCARIVRWMSVWSAPSKSSAFSSSSAYWRSDSATAVLSMTLQHAMESDEPTMRNSKRLPVNANGEVRLRSVVSRTNRGSTCAPSFMTIFSVPV